MGKGGAHAAVRGAYNTYHKTSFRWDAVLHSVHTGKLSQSEVSRRFRVPRTTIQSRLKCWVACGCPLDDGSSRALACAGLYSQRGAGHLSLPPPVEAALAEEIRERLRSKTPTFNRNICDIARHYHIPSNRFMTRQQLHRLRLKFSASIGWCARFKKRHKLTHTRDPHIKRGVCRDKTQAIDTFHSVIGWIIHAFSVPLNRIYAFDETPLRACPSHWNVVSMKGERTTIDTGQNMSC